MLSVGENNLNKPGMNCFKISSLRKRRECFIKKKFQITDLSSISIFEELSGSF
jgi:hypothetical protein